jgi:hypothetical protein
LGVKRVLVVDGETIEFQVVPKINPVLIASPKEPFRPKKAPVPEWILIGNGSRLSVTLESPASKQTIRSYTDEELSSLWRNKRSEPSE